MNKEIFSQTVRLDDEHSALIILDQTKLPNEKFFLHLKTQEEIFQAIYFLKVRGAPAIGVAAGYGIYLAIKEILQTAKNFEELFEKFSAAKNYLNSSRPTAVNLSMALNRIESVLEKFREKDFSAKKILDEVLHEARQIQIEDIASCKAIGEFALTLLKKGDGLLTHCNAGELATSQYGTATAAMYLGHEKQMNFKIYCDETRPLLQGARLTAYELSNAGMDVTLCCDNMAATLMQQGKISAVFVGCDRVAKNGDAANKIGTLPLAIVAKFFHVPFYVCCPLSTIDLTTETGKDILIEQRPPEEVSEMFYKAKMTADNVKIFNPAFDVTPADLISAIITEKGIIRQPLEKNLMRCFA